MTEIDTIVVSATRLQREGFTAPTPTTVISNQELERAAVVNPIDYLNKYVPSFAPTLTPSTSVTSTVRPAGNSPNLRNLGTKRTLVLVDGRRHVATGPDGLVDMDAIPSGLIERVDVVTGGASAAWGSDAVAGVVNLVLRRGFEGLEGGAQSGISEEDDNEQQRYNLAYGTFLLDGRAHFMIGADYVDRKGVVTQGDRGWARHDRQVVTIAGQRTVLSDVNRVATPGGVIVTASPAAGGSVPAGFVGTTFAPGGTIGEPFTFGTLVAPLTNPQATQVGGSGVPTQRDISLAAPSERWNILGRATFDITENVTAFAEASYAVSSFDDDIAYYGNGLTSTNSRPYTIQRDNAFLPTSIRDQMVASNINSFQLARLDYDMGPLNIQNEDRIKRFVPGLEGKFQALAGDWHWNAYWQRGESDVRMSQNNNRINGGAGFADNWALATDAILVNGAPVCRDPVARAAGCAPLNVFGPGPQSREALDYISADTWARMLTTEDVFAASISGEPFSTWAGPVSIATGAEYREVRFETELDPLNQAAADRIEALLATNPNPTQAQAAVAAEDTVIHGTRIFEFLRPGDPYGTAEGDVREAFLETVVPLAKGLPFAELFELNGAIRWTDYSQSGEVNTWKLGINWEPISGLRFRAAQSRDIRAPTLAELFVLGVNSQTSIVDPATGTQYTTTQRGGGNPTLVPEEADTTTFGVVWEPSFINGLTASVDAYDVDIANALAGIPAQGIVDLCAGGSASACAAITRDATTGQITLIFSGLLNSQRHRARGVDLELAYTRPVGDGNLSFRLLGNHTIESRFNGQEFAGTVGNGQSFAGAGAAPEWRGSLVGIYDRGSLNFSAAVRYVGEGTYNEVAAPGFLEIPAQTYVDASVQYNLVDRDKQRIQLYANVQNLFDRDPPLNPPTGFMALQSNPLFYDLIGRMFSAGVRFRY